MSDAYPLLFSPLLHTPVCHMSRPVAYDLVAKLVSRSTLFLPSTTKVKPMCAFRPVFFLKKLLGINLSCYPLRVARCVTCVTKTLNATFWRVLSHLTKSHYKTLAQRTITEFRSAPKNQKWISNHYREPLIICTTIFRIRLINSLCDGLTNSMIFFFTFGDYINKFNDFLTFSTELSATKIMNHLSSISQYFFMLCPF